MARLHDDGRQNSEPGINEQSGYARHCIVAQIDRRLVALESFLHEIYAEEQKTQTSQNRAKGLEHAGFLEVQHHPEHEHRQSKGREAHLHADSREQPGTGCGAKVGSENDANACDQRKQTGAQERYGNDRYQRAGLHNGGADDAEAQTLGNRVRGPAQHSLQEPAGKSAKSILEREHAKQEDRNARGNLFELWTRPQRKSQESEYSGKDELAIVHWFTLPAIGSGLSSRGRGATS